MCFSRSLHACSQLQQLQGNNKKLFKNGPIILICSKLQIIHTLYMHAVKKNPSLRAMFLVFTYYSHIAHG